MSIAQQAVAASRGVRVWPRPKHNAPLSDPETFLSQRIPTDQDIKHTHSASAPANYPSVACRVPRVLLLCFSRAPVAKWALSPQAIGLSTELIPPGVVFYGFDRAASTEHQATFDACLTGRSAELMKQQLAAADTGIDPEQVNAAATSVVRIEYQPGELNKHEQTEGTIRRAMDPPTLGYLQACWAVAKYCCAQPGALVMFDALQTRFFSSESVAALSPCRPFDLHREVTIVEEPQGEDLYLVFTRGLVKFGRPDLLMKDVPAVQLQRDLAYNLLMTLAGRLAEGETVDVSKRSAITAEVTVPASPNASVRSVQASLVPSRPGQNAPAPARSDAELIICDRESADDCSCRQVLATLSTELT